MVALDKPHRVTRDNYLPMLQGGRGIAALCIVLYHARLRITSGNFVSWGYLSVDYFFMLSGFILSKRYEAAIRNRNITFRTFALHRIARLYPVYLACLLAAVAALALPGNEDIPFNYLTHGHFIWNMTSQLLLLQVVAGPSVPWVESTWSLTVEWLVNILFFAIHRYRVAQVYLWYLFAAILYVLVLHKHLLTWHLSPPLFNGPMFRGTEGFGIGMLLFHLHHRLPPLRPALLHTLETLVVAALVVACYCHETAGFLDFLYFLVLFPLIILLSLYDKGWLGLFLSLPLCRWLGTISYSLYLWQTILPKVFTATPSFNMISLPLQGILFIAILIPLACASYRYIEQPGRTLIIKLGKPK